MTSKKLDNIFGTKFIMPEHASELNKFHKYRNKQVKPVLLEDEWEIINEQWTSVRS